VSEGEVLGRGKGHTFAALKAMPESVGLGFGDAVVDPARWDVVCKFVVEDCLKWGEYLVVLGLVVMIVRSKFKV